MILYLDTSAIVSLFLQESRTAAVERVIAETSEAICVSDFAQGEFAAAISTNVRIGRLTTIHGVTVLENFDVWSRSRVQARVIETTTTDIRLAIAFVRRFDLGLLFPDALHLAICARADATLVTGDHRQGNAGTVLGMDVMLV